MRCIYDSLAMKYRANYDKLCALTGNRYGHIHMLGGGIKDTLLCRLTASATGAEVKAGPVEATVMGNIAVCFISLGEISSLGEAREVIERSEPIATYLPTEHEEFNQAYEKYLPIVGKTSRK